MQAFIADFCRIGRCMRFGGRRHYVFRPDCTAYSKEISGGETCKTTATDCNLRFLIAVICRYFRKSHHGPNGIASGDYRFDFKSAVFYLLALEKHLEYMEKYIIVTEKKAHFPGS